MAHLISDEEEQRRFALDKTVTSIGNEADADIPLTGAIDPKAQAHIVKEGEGHRILANDGDTVLVNGTAVREHALGSGDVIEIAGKRLVYQTKEEPRDHRTLEANRLEALRELFRFSERVANSPTLDHLKRNLVDAVIKVAEADRGYLLLISDWGSTAVDVARDVQGNDLSSEAVQISDSIVQKAMERRTPVLIADALEDTAFAETRSVVNFQIRTVSAVPIAVGEKVLGVLYLSSDRVVRRPHAEFAEYLMIFASQAALLVENAILVETLKRDNAHLKESLDRQTFGEIIGGCPAMQAVFRAVSRLAKADISTLVVGETGTGKELIAREIHRCSPRANGPFVAINVAAIPENLLESELFGYVKGAFTGATTNRDGKLRRAHQGTLFLDEIGDMPLALQAKLLRVLQERIVEPVGSSDGIPIDVRIVAATHRDLHRMQEEALFRADLYYRIAETTIELPPLRERGDDIALLASYFLARLNDALDRRIRRFTPRALIAMRNHRWPGNIRELEAKVKNAIVMAESDQITADDLGLDAEEAEPTLPLKLAKERYAERYVREVLARNAGNRARTARELEVDPRTVFKYLEGK